MNEPSGSSAIRLWKKAFFVGEMNFNFFISRNYLESSKYCLERELGTWKDKIVYR